MLLTNWGEPPISGDFLEITGWCLASKSMSSLGLQVNLTKITRMTITMIIVKLCKIDIYIYNEWKNSCDKFAFAHAHLLHPKSTYQCSLSELSLLELSCSKCSNLKIWRLLLAPTLIAVKTKIVLLQKNGGARTIFQYLPVKWREPSINQWETDFCTSWGFRVLCEALKMSVGVTYRMGGSSHHGVKKLVGWRIMHVLIMAPIWWISKSWRHPFKIITHTYIYIQYMYNYTINYHTIIDHLFELGEEIHVGATMVHFSIPMPWHASTMGA